MKISKGALSLICLTTMLLSVMCRGNQTRWRGTIEVVDGVAIVKNPILPLHKDDILTIEEDLSIGGAQGGEESLFGYISLIAVDNEENIYVADTKDAHIQVYDSEGNYLRTIGRRGQGPGEFNSILSFLITPNNELLVQDRSASRWTVFSLNGDYLKTVLIKDTRILGVRRINSKGNYFVETTDFQRKGRNKSWHNAKEICEYTPDMRFIKTIIKDKFRDVTSPPMITRFTSSDLIIYGDPEKTYEIRILDANGKIIRKIFKEYEPYNIGDEEKGTKGLIKSKELPKDFPPYENVSVDEGGRLFVQLYEKPEDGSGYFFDVFDTDGKYIAKVALKAIPQYWKKGKLYAIEADDNGYQYIKRYKVTWKF